MCLVKPKVFTIWPFSGNVENKLLYHIHNMIWIENLYHLQGLIQNRSAQPDYASPGEIEFPTIS